MVTSQILSSPGKGLRRNPERTGSLCCRLFLSNVLTPLNLQQSTVQYSRADILLCSVKHLREIRCPEAPPLDNTWIPNLEFLASVNGRNQAVSSRKSRLRRAEVGAVAGLDKVGPQASVQWDFDV